MRRINSKTSTFAFYNNSKNDNNPQSTIKWHQFYCEMKGKKLPEHFTLPTHEVIFAWELAKVSVIFWSYKKRIFFSIKMIPKWVREKAIKEINER